MTVTTEEIPKNLRRYKCEFYTKEFAKMHEQFFRAKNKWQLKDQVQESWMFGNLRSIFVYLKKKEEFAKLLPTFRRK
jgi:hypothetical protein